MSGEIINEQPDNWAKGKCDAEWVDPPVQRNHTEEFTEDFT